MVEDTTNICLQLLLAVTLLCCLTTINAKPNPNGHLDGQRNVKNEEKQLIALLKKALEITPKRTLNGGAGIGGSGSPAVNPILGDPCNDDYATVQGSSVTIVSPDYDSGSYINGMKCRWMLTVPDGTDIKLHFNVFGLEPHNRCLFDYLRIYQGHIPGVGSTDTFQETLCGSSVPADVIISGNKATMFFRSDYAATDRGFNLTMTAMGTADPSTPDSNDPTYEESPPNPGGQTVSGDPCSGSTASAEGDGVNILSPGFETGEYPASADCKWNLEVPVGKHIKLNFEVFGIEDNTKCSYDYLSVYRGFVDSTTIQPFQKMCGMSNPAPLIIPDHKATLVFKSDSSVQKAGFHIVMETIDPVQAAAPNAGACDFETDFCGWSVDSTQQWIRFNPSCSSHTHKYLFPTNDVNPGLHTGTYIISDSDGANKGEAIRLISPVQTPTQENGRCLRFAYRMKGYKMGDFFVRINVGGEDTKMILTRTGDHGSQWYRAMAHIGSNQDHHLVLEMVVGDKKVDYIAIDDLSITDGPCITETVDCGNRNNKRVLNGETANTNEWPFIAHIRANTPDGSYLQCGASLVHPQWLVTAAHCFEHGGTILRDVDVHFGETSFNEPEDSNFKITSKEVFIHPDRTATGVAPFDIAMIKLPYPLHFTENVSPICMPNEISFAPGTLCNGIGWGKDGSGKTTRRLFYTREKIVTQTQCKQHFGYTAITSDMQCTEAEDHSIRQSVCGGDSGGPLACKVNGKYYLAGATSWGPLCSNLKDTTGDIYSVYTSVKYQYSFIEQTMADNTDEPVQ